MRSYHLQMDNLTSSFPIWMSFISFPCLIALARTSSTKLNRSGHPHTVSGLRGKAYTLSPMNMVLTVALSHMAFMMLRQFPFIPSLLVVFIMKGCYVLSNVYSASGYWSVVFFSCDNGFLLNIVSE